MSRSDSYPRRVKDAASQVKKLRGWAASDATVAEPLVDALNDLTALRLAGHEYADAPTDAQDAVAALSTMPGCAHRTVELCRKAGVRFDAIDHCTVLARTIPEDIRSDELTHVASVFAVSARMAALESLQGTLMRA